MHRNHRPLPGIALLIGLGLSACASGPATQNKAEHETLKTGLLKGESVSLANSCSIISHASFSMNYDVKFGACYLTNLRFIFEESEWYKALKATSKLVPTSGDFGIKQILQAGNETFDAFYIVKMGNRGELELVRRDGQIIFPLSAIKSTQYVKSESAILATLSAEKNRGKRLFSIASQQNKKLIFEMYDLPPHKTGFYPQYITEQWMQEIQLMKNKTFKTK